MSLYKELKSYVLEECEENKVASLVNVMARFDFHQHAIPTLRELRLALNEIGSISIFRKKSKILLSLDKKDSYLDVEDITDEDMEATYQEYIKKIGGS